MGHPQNKAKPIYISKYSFNTPKLINNFSKKKYSFKKTVFNLKVFQEIALNSQEMCFFQA